MKRLSALLAAGLFILAVPAAALAADEVFKASLTGDAQVPPITVDATGKATVTIADDESSVSWKVTYSGLTGDAAAGHIHFGAADAAGPVMIPFASVSKSGSDGSFASGDYAGGEGLPADWDAVLAAIRDGDAYVNIHTAANQAGEIRGQLAVSTAPPATDTVAVTTSPQAPAPLGILLVVGALGFAVALRRFTVR
ncbi:MAG: CHRD domain-containing protein [Candidatus Limnocylindrales bacterium]